MNTNSRFFHWFSACLIILFPFVSSAKQEFAVYAMPDLPVLTMSDSTSRKQPGKPDDKKEDVKRPDIKEVPKSKRHLKPAAVKARIKIKTPVKIRPNIKRPMGLIRKALGR